MDGEIAPLSVRFQYFVCLTKYTFNCMPFVCAIFQLNICQCET